MKYPIDHRQHHPIIEKLHRVARRVITRLRPACLSLFYHEAYRPRPTGLIDDRRAEKVLQFLLDEGLITRRHVSAPARASLAQLRHVHDAEYLESLDHAEQVNHVFGGLAGVADAHHLIDQQRWMCGGTIAASRAALAADRGRGLAINLGGGLHHAHRAKGGGFCLFNDVAIALSQVRREGFTGRALVVDLDLHQGDGTRQIFADDPSVWTCSIHGVDWDGEAIPRDTNVALGHGIADEAYLETLKRFLPGVFDVARPDLVFYVAGVDVAIDDHLGNWRVSADGVLARDMLVHTLCGSTPSVWTLAGGYGPDAWRHTARTLRTLLADDPSPLLSNQERELQHFRRIARRLGREELTKEPMTDLAFTLEDVMGDLTTHAPSRLLGYYSKYGVELALERYGVLEKLRAQGFASPIVELQLDHSAGEMITVQSNDDRRDRLVELAVKIRFDITPLKLLSAEWLLLQNPRRAAPARALLPGQDHPGLGCFREIVMMLIIACERLGFDGLLFNPAHFHMAALAKGFGVFVDPHDEARFTAVTAALEGKPLAKASRLVAEKALIDVTTGAPFEWPAARVVCPISQRAKAQFESPEYDRLVEEAVKGLELRLRSEGEHHRR